MQASKIWLVAALLVVLALEVSSRTHEGPAVLSRELTASAQAPPPTPEPTPAPDTTRYVAWMEKQGKPIKDQPHEEVSLRVGDWGFFYHGDRPVGSWTPLQDKVGLDRSGHAVAAPVYGQSSVANGDWYALLSTDGLDAMSALKRVAWLFNAEALDPENAPKGERNRISSPTLSSENGVITFQGWCEKYSDPPYNAHIKIVATIARADFVIGRGEKP